MNLTIISEMLALLLAISLATERLVIIIRTPINFLNKENPNPEKDRLRRFLLQVISFCCACITVGFLAKGEWDIMDKIQIGDSFHLPLLILAILAMGGSSLWKNLLGYSKAARAILDDKNKRKKRER